MLEVFKGVELGQGLDLLLSSRPVEKSRRTPGPAGSDRPDIEDRLRTDGRERISILSQTHYTTEASGDDGAGRIGTHTPDGWCREVSTTRSPQLLGRG